MKFRYDSDEDLLTVLLQRDSVGEYDFEGGGVIATINEGEELVSLVIANARRFVTKALQAGINLEGGPVVQRAKGGMQWYDADSSMISAYGYDEEEEILEVAFHNSGVYRYFEVPYEVFKGLQDASSKGSYMHSNIIDLYPYEKKRGRSRR